MARQILPTCFESVGCQNEIVPRQFPRTDEEHHEARKRLDLSSQRRPQRLECFTDLSYTRCTKHRQRLASRQSAERGVTNHGLSLSSADVAAPRQGQERSTSLPKPTTRDPRRCRCSSCTTPSASAPPGVEFLLVDLKPLALEGSGNLFHSLSHVPLCGADRSFPRCRRGRCVVSPANPDRD